MACLRWNPVTATNSSRMRPFSAATVSGQIGEVWRGAHQEGVGDRPLQVTVRALDGAVLVGDAGVVAGRRHPVMSAESLVATGQVGLGRRVQITEGRRQAVGPVLARGAAERPERVLQALGECDEALAPENHMRVLEAGVIPTRVKADSFRGFQNGASSESCPSASATGPMHDAQCGLV